MSKTTDEEITGLHALLEEKLRKQREEATAAEVAKKRKRDEQKSSNEVIASLGLHSADYYHDMSIRVGMLRKKLGYINLLFTKEAKNSDEMQCVVPIGLLDDEAVRSALQVQGFKVLREVVPKVCVCGRENDCGLDTTGCSEEGRVVSWRKD